MYVLPLLCFEYPYSHLCLSYLIFKVLTKSGILHNLFPVNQSISEILEELFPFLFI